MSDVITRYCLLSALAHPFYHNLIRHNDVHTIRIPTPTQCQMSKHGRQDRYHPVDEARPGYIKSVADLPTGGPNQYSRIKRVEYMIFDTRTSESTITV